LGRKAGDAEEFGMRKGIRLQFEAVIHPGGVGGSGRILLIYDDVTVVIIQKKLPPGCRQCQPIVSRLA
jgi:hypothetical protein